MSDFLYTVSTNHNLKLKNVANNLMGIQIAQRLFCDRNSGAFVLRGCYQNSSNENVKNLLKQELKEMNDNDKFYILENLYLKQISSGFIVLDKGYGTYPIFSGKTSKDIAGRFLKLYNNNNDYIYKNGFLQINPDTWPEIAAQSSNTRTCQDIGILLNL